MQIALSLLISAMQLLTLVSATPNITPEFRDSAILLANQAITTAQEEIAKESKIEQSPSVEPIAIGSTTYVPVEQVVKREVVKTIEAVAIPCTPYNAGLQCVVSATYREDGEKGPVGTKIEATVTEGSIFSDMRKGTGKNYDLIRPDALGVKFVYYTDLPGEKTVTFNVNGISKDLIFMVK